MVQGRPGDSSTESSEIQDPSILTSMPIASWLKVTASAPAVISIPGSRKEEWDRDGPKRCPPWNFNLHFSLEHVFKAITFIYCHFLPPHFFGHRIVDFLICFGKLYIRYINSSQNNWQYNFFLLHHLPDYIDNDVW